MSFSLEIKICDRGYVQVNANGDTSLLAKQSACVESRIRELVDTVRLSKWDELKHEPRNILEEYLSRRDPVIEQVVHLLRSRSRRGIAKYGQTLDRDDLELVDWLNHLQEELSDGLAYCQRVLNGIRENKTESGLG